jgi:hypothetical protein
MFGPTSACLDDETAAHHDGNREHGTVSAVSDRRQAAVILDVASRLP